MTARERRARLFYNRSLNPMQHASSTLRKIFSETLRREGSAAPMLAWPLACGTKTADRTQAISFAEGILTIAVPDETQMNFILLLRKTSRQQSHYVFGPAAAQMRKKQQDFCSLRHRLPERKLILAECRAFNVCSVSLRVS